MPAIRSHAGWPLGRACTSTTPRPPGGPPAPEPELEIAALHDALAIAHAQGARPFELRIALDLHEHLGEEASQPLKQAVAAFPRTP